MGSPAIGQRWEIEEHPVCRDTNAFMRFLHNEVWTSSANQANSVQFPAFGSN
jgi:hypothetical protein